MSDDIGGNYYVHELKELKAGLEDVRRSTHQ